MAQAANRARSVYTSREKANLSVYIPTLPDTAFIGTNGGEFLRASSPKLLKEGAVSTAPFEIQCEKNGIEKGRGAKIYHGTIRFNCYAQLLFCLKSKQII